MYFKQTAQAPSAAAANVQAPAVVVAAAKSSLPIRPTVSSSEQAQVDQLMSMGFPADQSLYAFLESGKKVEQAVEKLLTGGVLKAPYRDPEPAAVTTAPAVTGEQQLFCQKFALSLDAALLVQPGSSIGAGVPTAGLVKMIYSQTDQAGRLISGFEATPDTPTVVPINAAAILSDPVEGETVIKWTESDGMVRAADFGACGTTPDQRSKVAAEFRKQFAACQSGSVSATAVETVQWSEPHTFATAMSPQSSDASYNGVFFEIRAGDKDIMVTAFSAGSESDYGSEAHGTLYSISAPLDLENMNRDAFNQWQKVATVPLKQREATPAKLDSALFIQANAVCGMYFHSDSGNSAVCYDTSGDQEQGNGDIHLVPNCRTDSREPMGDRQTKKRLPAGNVTYKVLTAGSLATAGNPADAALDYPAPRGTVLKVAGAGLVRSNGYYAQEGVYNGHVEYWKVDPAGQKLTGIMASNIFWRMGGEGWGIHGVNLDGTQAAYISNMPDAARPPEKGWVAAGGAESLPVIEHLVEPGSRPIMDYAPAWSFTRFECCSRRQGELSNGGRTVRGKGDWYWCTGPPVPSNTAATYFYEVKIDSVHDTADLYFGYGKAGLTKIGDDSSVPGIYCYKSYKNPPSIYPSDTNLGEQHKTKSGDVVRVELDTSEHVVTFYRNGERVGRERIKPDHAKGKLAPYVTVYYRGASITLRDAGVGASWTSNGPFGTPVSETQLLTPPPGMRMQTPINSFELLTRRLPVLIEAQFVYERPFHSAANNLTPYFQALCDLGITLGIHKIPFNAKSIDWMARYCETLAVVESFVGRSPLPKSFIDKLKELPLFSHWSAQIPAEWGAVKHTL